jgi:hypothetical protein
MFSFSFITIKTTTTANKAVAGGTIVINDTNINEGKTGRPTA